MANINQLSTDTQPQLADQLALWSQNNGQPRKVSLSAILELIQSNLSMPNGLLSASSLYELRRTQAETLAVGPSPVIVAPYDANGNTVLPIGGTALTLNVVTGVMQASRVIEAAELWVCIDGSLPSPRVLTLQVQTGPGGGGGIYTSELQAIKTGTGNPDSFHFAGILQNPNNVNGQINAGDVVQIVASADQATTLSISRMSFIVRPLDGA
ncbi:hypothetical protein C9I56_11185 [Paraburkholderia caribensis]|uniref:hypothetical protein n=1 Tax=Paraburkholderia caribensis TaxID=75105 RepID=UPI000D15E18A|nr:hypothetical protein [Paraburkholderia caribensis]PTB28846.1 hypothetical protein C9I56_11185 [Paraburkholderia caribensis]